MMFQNQHEIVQKKLLQIANKQTNKTNESRDLFSFDRNNNIFLGSLLKANQNNKTLVPLLLSNQDQDQNETPITLFVSRSSYQNEDINPVTVEKVTGSSVQQGVKKLLNQMSGILSSPSEVYEDLLEIKTKEDLKISLGLAFNIQPLFYDLNVDFSDKCQTTYALLIYKQINYSLSVDFNNSQGAYNLLPKNITIDQIEENINNDEDPVFVSTIHYGFTVAVLIQSKKSFSHLKMHINTNIKKIAQLNSSTKVAGECMYDITKYYINGGNEQVKEIIGLKNIDDIKEKLANVNCNGLPIFYQLSHLANNLLFWMNDESGFNYKINRGISSANKIDAIYIIPNSPTVMHINLESIKDLNNNDLIINLEILKESAFIKKLIENENGFPNIYNILIFGGADGRNNYKRISREIVEKYIMPYHKKGGSILFLHDFITKMQIESFYPILQELEFLGENTTIDRFTKVQFIQKFFKEEIALTPHRFDSSFEVSKTHASALYDPHYIVIHSKKIKTIIYIAKT